MIEIEEKAASVYVDVKGGEVTANITPADNISVTVGQSAQIDVGAAVNYIESGRAEIQPLVDEAKGYKNEAAASAENAANSADAAEASAERAETAAEYVENMANKDLSNLSATGEAKFDAKQDVISDLSAIRSGASAGSTAVQPTDLATVATSGNYNDLSNKPAIPSKTSDLTNDSGFITLSTLTPYATQTWVENKGYLTEIPAEYVTDSELTAKGYQTAADVETAITAKGYTTMSAVEAKGYITNAALAPYVLSSSLATVATSGSYNDLSNKPTIPAAQVNADWNATSGVARILNKPTIPTVPTNVSAFTNDAGYITSSALSGYATQTWVGQQGFITGITSSDVTTALGYTPYNSSNPSGYITSAALTPYALSANLATVATSGSYSDLSNTPTIPTVNNATITITQGGTTKGTFTLNQSSNATIALDAGGGGGGSYTAGDGIIIENNEISVDGVQTSELSIDTTPTQNSSNLITSGGVYAVLGDIESAINTIRGV